MISPSQTVTSSPNYRGTDKLITGIVLTVITFWLFAQTTLNIAAVMSADLKISHNLNNLAVSITALFSGIFVVVAGGLADKIGRVKNTNIGSWGGSGFWFVGGTDPKIYLEAKKNNQVNSIPSNHSPKFAPVLYLTLKTGLQAMMTAAAAWLK